MWHVRSTIRALVTLLGVLASIAVPRSASAQCENRFADGPAFTAQTPGLDTNGVIFSSCLWDPDGAGYQHERLAVAGSFTSIGGVSARNIAMWDGTHWTEVPQGFNAVVVAVASFNNELCAGGFFTASGSTTCFISLNDSSTDAN
jgi:hypothetical protein